jgi:flagellar protein FlbD
MIQLTRLNGREFFLNADLIATVESHPDTVVTLVDGKSFVAVEPASQVVDAVMQYRAGVLALAERIAAESADDVPPTAQLRARRPAESAGARAAARQLYVLRSEDGE